MDINCLELEIYGLDRKTGLNVELSCGLNWIEYVLILRLRFRKRWFKAAF